MKAPLIILQNRPKITKKFSASQQKAMDCTCIDICHALRRWGVSPLRAKQYCSRDFIFPWEEHVPDYVHVIAFKAEVLGIFGCDFMYAVWLFPEGTCSRKCFIASRWNDCLLNPSIITSAMSLSWYKLIKWVLVLVASPTTIPEKYHIMLIPFRWRF